MVNMTKKNDIVLINVGGKAVNFARIEQITPDSKLGWFKVKLMLLQVPVVVTTWVLREKYINGDKFTMEGQIVHLEKVTCPSDNLEDNYKTMKYDNVISLSDYSQ